VKTRIVTEIKIFSFFILPPRQNNARQVLALYCLACGPELGNVPRAEAELGPLGNELNLPNLSNAYLANLTRTL